jgi:predicted SprT family Zn-dependent metalloprotease
MIKSFQVMGHTVKVKFGRVPREAWAYYRSDTKEIVLSPRLKKSEQSFFDQTLMHEICHCVLDHMGREDLNSDEGFVDLLSNCLHNVVQTITRES